jgi:hypothetical protein
MAQSQGSVLVLGVLVLGVLVLGRLLNHYTRLKEGWGGNY